MLLLLRGCSDGDMWWDADDAESRCVLRAQLSLRHLHMPPISRQYYCAPVCKCVVCVCVRHTHDDLRSTWLWYRIAFVSLLATSKLLISPLSSYLRLCVHSIKIQTAKLITVTGERYHNHQSRDPRRHRRLRRRDEPAAMRICESQASIVFSFIQLNRNWFMAICGEINFAFYTRSPLSRWHLMVARLRQRMQRNGIVWETSCVYLGVVLNDHLRQHGQREALGRADIVEQRWQQVDTCVSLRASGVRRNLRICLMPCVSAIDLRDAHYLWVFLLSISASERQ